ncbi:hypothetical protein AOXY_G16239 [Acipenser oxyrinchus oxyrinchus]|uniref:Uncharacterized protein n=1 Tax=Acipenser oxyrinchus oxyrinchus TaxID=40147 RepID=A0AAD8G402_ACIOX|nr:hypothetical protein AOXY_G16239 [Acipenser oxyrinchus oxyrinchus]
MFLEELGPCRFVNAHQGSIIQLTQQRGRSPGGGEEAAEGDSDWDTGYRVQGGLRPGSDRSALLNRNVCQVDCNERIWFLLGCHGDYGKLFPLDSRGGCLM